MTTQSTTAILADIKEAIRQRYAWPGGYALYGYVERSADILCTRCMRDNYRRVSRDTRDGWGGWGITAIVCTQFDEHDLQCSNCYQYLATCWRAADGQASCEEGCLMTYPAELLP